MRCFTLTAISLTLAGAVAAQELIGIIMENDSTETAPVVSETAGEVDGSDVSTIDNAPNDSIERESIANASEGFDFDTEIEQPLIPSKYVKPIQVHMNSIGENYLRQGYKVSSLRNGLVIRIAVPSDLLFMPNDTILNQSAKSKLTSFLPLIRNKSDYKILLAVHCDNTGNAEYQSKLTEGRMYAILDWFDSNVSSTRSALLNGEYYGSEKASTYFDENDTEKLIDNRSRENRRNNRRIELYVIPNTGLIQKAKDKKL